jgi:hypothetical protein
MTKVIFLDIDGVLNNGNNCGDPPICEQKNKIETYLDPSAITYVNRLIKDHEAKIVMSTSWRMHDKNLKLLFSAITDNFDLRDFLVRSGLTNNFHEDWHTPVPNRFGEIINGRPRGFEINDWLENHPDITNWVALDDLCCGFEEKGIKEHLAQTSFKKGLTRKEYELANRILAG